MSSTPFPEPAGSRPAPPSTVLAAGVLLIIKAALGLWLGLVLIAASRTRHRRFLGAVIRHRAAAFGVLILVLTALTLVVGIELLRVRPWARTGAFVLEGISIVSALTRIGRRPGQVILSLAFSLVVILLLLTSDAAASFRASPITPSGGAGPGAPPSPPGLPPQEPPPQ
jgi:hypothetical protein